MPVYDRFCPLSIKGEEDGEDFEPGEEEEDEDVPEEDEEGAGKLCLYLLTLWFNVRSDLAQINEFLYTCRIMNQ